jgi:phosphoglycerol transferase MdoB-like AlkP superfamily enzyme
MPAADTRWRRLALLRALGAAALLVLYILFLAAYAVLAVHASDPASHLLLIMAVAGTVSMLGVTSANLWARSRPAATGKARALALACLALLAVAVVAVLGGGMYLSASSNSLAFLPAIVWTISLLTAALPAVATVRALAAPAAGRAARPGRPAR